MTLGPPIRKQPESPPEWVETETKGIERNTRTGVLRTNLPLPKIPVPDVVLPLSQGEP